MKAIAPFFFTFLYLLAMIRPVFPVFEYVINQDYIAEFLCINQDRPELACDGKCYLMQMLQEQNEEKKNKLPAIALEEYPIGFVELYGLDNNAKLGPDTIVLSYYSNSYSFLYSFEDFHPPTLSE